MSEIVIFGGTTEGRLLAEYSAENGIHAVVCVVSEYGHQVLPESPYLQVRTKALDEEAMVELIEKEKPRMVLDATHPYAAAVTGNILGACDRTGTVYHRVSRKETKNGSLACADNVLWVPSVEAAAEYLATTRGAVLVTTGSKELKAYTSIPGYEERIYARVLPGTEMIEQCQRLGIAGKHIIAMQGPYSREMNAAMLHHTGAGYLVTKEAGAAGGFMEKIEAALACQVFVVVIGRPEKPEGISVKEAFTLLSGCRREPGLADRKKLVLIGMGMGGRRQMTVEAVRRLQESDVILGAPRMLESIGDAVPEAAKVSCYLSQDVMQWLKQHTRYQTVCVVYSGDTGFYSGAKGLLEAIRLEGTGFEYETEVLPGISSVSYLCSKLGVSWEDAYLASAHGRDLDICGLLKDYKKMFLLLGGEDSVGKLCRQMVENGYGHVTVSVGERLSYEDERVVTGRAENWAGERFDTLSAVLIRQ